MSTEIDEIRCSICGKIVESDGYKISWNIKDLGLVEEGDERYFCSIDCVEKWVNNLSITGQEEISIEELASDYM